MSTSFYATAKPEHITYLEFGSKHSQSEERAVWDYREHQEAYDLFMLARYMKDLISFRNLSENISTHSVEEIWKTYQEEVFTADIFNSFSKLAALECLSSATQNNTPTSFLELGSTLFGAIDAMAFVQEYLEAKTAERSDVALDGLSYLGLDISKLLNDVAKEIHPAHRITTFLSVEDIPDHYSVFFAKGVSLLYATSSQKEFVDFIAPSEVAVFDYSFSLQDDQEEVLGTGKKIKKLSIQNILTELRQRAPEKHLYIEENSALVKSEKEQIRVYCVVAEEAIAEQCFKKEQLLKQAVLNSLEDSSLHSLFFPVPEQKEKADRYCTAEEFLERC